MVKKINFFIIHCKYTPERGQIVKRFIEVIKSFSFRNIKVQEVTVIDEYDPNDITPPLISQIVKYDRIEDPNLEIYNQLLRNLHINQLSNTLKHMTALEKASKCGEHDLNIILEDDMLYEDKVCLSLERFFSQLPSRYDIIFLGMPTINEMKVSTEYQFEETKKLFRVLPMCDSYMVNTKTARSLVAHYAPIKFVNNVQLSFVAEKLGLKCQQCIPNIFVDGSKYGLFVSRVSPNNPLVFNGEYTAFSQILGKQPFQKEDIERIEQLISSSSIRQHPDFIHLVCKYYVMQGDYEKALQCFEEAYKIYNASGCVLTNESLFLKDYIRLHKHIQ